MAYIETRLIELRQAGVILPQLVTDERILPISGVFCARAVLIPNLTEKQVRIIQRTEKGECFFCDPGEALLSEQESFLTRDYRVLANGFPYIEDQIMLAVVDHRELPKLADFAEAFAFQRRTQLIGFLNLRESGASVPGHLHFEFGKVEAPILRLPMMPTNYAFQDASITTLADYPGLVLAVHDCDESCLARAVHPITEALFTHNLSVNLVFDQQKTLVIPRTATESGVFPNWRVGSLFLSGIFIPDARQSQSQDTASLLTLIEGRFLAINPEQYRTVIVDVTLPLRRPEGLPELFAELGLPELQKTEFSRLPG